MQRRFNSLNDVKKYLAHVVNELDAGNMEADAGRVRGYIASILHKVLLDNDLEARITELEKLAGIKK